MQRRTFATRHVPHPQSIEQTSGLLGSLEGSWFAILHLYRPRVCSCSNEHLMLRQPEALVSEKKNREPVRGYESSIITLPALSSNILAFFSLFSAFATPVWILA